MAELLLELFSEEIPARMQQRAAADLQKLVNQALLDAGFMPEAVKAFATPRRLTLVASGLPTEQPDRREERKGPRVGAPEKAVEGFLRAAGLSSLDECETRSDKKGEFYVAVSEQKGRRTAEVIADFAPQIVRDFPWPKAMRWGASSAEETSLKWVRPLQSILCVFDGEPVTFNVDGVASGGLTYGHRFMAPDALAPRSFEDYQAALKSAFVVLDGAARADQIAGEARTLCEAQGLELVEDKGLLAEVAGLAEWPVVMIGSFDEKFLALPDEVLIASMRGHQKYFSVRDPKAGRLANKFIVVANIEAPDGGAAMRNGYERVLTARLSDGWYLYHQDLKTPLAERTGDLARISFFEGLGAVGDKVERIANLAALIAPMVGADAKAARRAAELCKADLVTGMVYEFPELQGLMGRYYAAAQGEAQDVADAIRDHYKPQGQDDEIPAAPVSMAVALADKIDTLVAFFAIDKKPTGSSDPFALRRAALGVAQIALQSNVRLSLGALFDAAFEALNAAYPVGRSVAEAKAELLGFFHDRLKVYLRDQGRRHDHIEAVLSDASGGPQDDLVLIAARLGALEAFLSSADGENLLAAFKRATNILKAEAKKGDLPSGDSVAADALLEAAEKDLFAALEPGEAAAQKALQAEDFEGAMSALSALRAPIDAFFESVTVNADEPSLRANRLALLARFSAAVGLVADFSKLEG